MSVATAGGRVLRVLVVDDDDVTRELAISVLRRAGVDARGAASGTDALFEIARDPSIKLLVTDIVMPGTVDGWALARKAKCLRPELGIVYMSAFATAAPGDGEEPGYGPLLPKPWRPQQLQHCVRRLARASSRCVA